jgi:serine/threonine-protein kinase
MNDSLAPTDPPTAGPRPGARFGAWQLREPLGSGGMGEVWAATRSDGLHAGRAAVKLLRAASPDPAAAALLSARFAREGELLARLTHPHIAQLLDAGIAPDGTRYLVLEYVQGERIDHWCDARRLDLPSRLNLLLQLCDAVAFAHANLVVHRDLKPANVLVTDGGHVKLLDFGVAKLLGDAPDELDLTRQGSAGLTPDYAAPEQITGGAVTVATDVYALGVLMFVLLSGQRPYDAPRGNAAQLARAIAEAEPRRLGAAELTSTFGGDASEIAAARSTTPQRLRQALRGDLEHIVAKALRKRPAERYASAQALADDLRHFLKHESVSAQAPTWFYVTRKFIERHTLGVAAAGLVALAIAGGVAATLWQASVAREQAARATAEARNATAIKDFLLGVFRTSTIGAGKTTQDTTARELLQAGGKRLLDDAKLESGVRLELLTVVGELQNNLGMFDSADPLEQRALALARSVHGPQSEQYIYALVGRALSLTQLGRAQESEALAREAIAIVERTGQQSLEGYAIALYRVGANAVQAGELRKGIADLSRATAAFEKYQPRHAMRSIAHRWLGNGLAQLDDFGAAERELRRSIELSANQVDLRDFGTGAGHYALGQLFARAGRFADAQSELTQALAIFERTMGPRHRTTALVRCELGVVLHQLGRPAESRAMLASALDIAGSDTSRQVGNAMDRVNIALAQVAADEQRPEESLTRMAAAAKRWEAQGGAHWAATLVAQGEAETRDGNVAVAREVLRQALPILDTQLGPNALATRQAQVALGEALESDARAADDARLAFASALAAGSAASPTGDWLRARALLGQGRLALATDPATALRLAREAQALVNTGALRERQVQAQARTLEARADAQRLQ